MIGIEVDSDRIERLVKNRPRVLERSLGDAIERIGRKMERDAKQYAPVISGNLRRTINFERTTNGGRVRAEAKYAHFVHGSPYWSPSSSRRTTPFFTEARDNNQGFAEKEMANALTRAINREVK